MALAQDGGYEMHRCVHACVSDSMCESISLPCRFLLNYCFYCATIAYHVGLNAVSDGRRASWPASKNNRHL